MDLLAYVGGVLAHILFKWASWKTKDRAWGDYWREYAGLNIASAVAAVVCYGLWSSGAIPAVMGALIPEAAIPAGPWGALMAGYGLDSVARTLFMTWEKRATGGTGGPS